MPRVSANSLPRLQHHKASGQAVLTLNGHDFYCGKHGTKTAKAEYDRLIAQWLANGRQLPRAGSDPTIVELLVQWRRHALKHYRKPDGSPTGEVSNFDDAIKPLRRLYGRELVSEFGPLKLQAVRTLMVQGFKDAKGKDVRPWCRKTINAQVARIKRIFRWAVSQELAPASLAHALDSVAGLQYGRSQARETAPVHPVDDSVIEATIPHLPAVVADMVRFQRLTGARPTEVCDLCPCDLDRTGDTWIYRPRRHKTQHLGRERLIYIGPKGQAILQKYLNRPADQPCFSPVDSERARKAAMRAARKTPVQPSQIDRSKPVSFFVRRAIFAKPKPRRGPARFCVQLVHCATFNDELHQ